MTYIGDDTVVTCSTFAARSGVCASFLETESIALGPSTDLYIYTDDQPFIRTFLFLAS